VETVGWLDDRPLTYGEVARFQRTRDPEAFSRSLEGLVLERVTLEEAQARGVGAPEPLLRRRTEARMQDWERRVRAAAKRNGDPAIDPALWLRRVAGVSLEEFRGWVRRHTRVELLQDRLLRSEMLASPRIEVSLMVVKGRPAADRAAAQARQGGDFAALARKLSVHSSREQGGRIPFPLLPEDINLPSIRQALFKAATGEILGPFPASGRAGDYFQIYKLERKAAAERGPPAALAALVEKDLHRRPVVVGEYERWRRRVLLRHGFVAAAPSGETG